MIPAGFDYHAPTTLDEAVRLLGDSGEDVKVLAGGQSLIPVLRLRLAAPETVIDLGRVDELRGVRLDGDTLVLGAMTSHHDVATHELVRQHARVLSEAAATVADPQVRHRGTFGGALAHADPAGDMPAPVLALGGEMVVVGPGGRRTVPAADFFEDLFTTALGEDELLAEIRIPSHDGWGGHYEKFTRVAQQWSIVAVAAAVRVEGGSISEARVALTNMGSTAVRAEAVERALIGVAAEDDAVRAAAAQAVEGTSPPSDTNGDADYRRHLATVLTRRAVLAAAGA
ncbi:MAG: xanthine dehydrogenase family protein subunit M [Actinomycetota bacterium]|nr:xanthine dehydrogenase family protein subunit M [Actinomycetota bacterium]